MENHNDKLDEMIYYASQRIMPPCDTRLSQYIGGFFVRLPKKDLEYFLYDVNIMILQPAANSFAKFDPTKYVEEMILISFVTDLFEHPHPDIIYTIAHEFAHVYLKHPPWSDRREAIEIEADQQVIKWGFEKELKESIHSYMYGERK